VLGEAAGGHSGAVWMVKFAPGGELLVSCSEDATVKVWGRDAGGAWRHGATLAGHFAGAVYGVDVDPSGRIVACSRDNSVRVFERAGDAGYAPAAAAGNAHDSCDVNCVAWRPAPPGDTVASCGDDGTVRLWRVAGPG